MGIDADRLDELLAEELGGASPRPQGRPESPRGGNGASQRPQGRPESPRGGGGGSMQAQRVSNGGALLRREERKAAELGWFLLFIAAILWLVNAVYTAEGCVVLLNLIASWFRLGIVLPPLNPWVALPIGIALGVFITRGQIVQFPFRRHQGITHYNGIGAVISWSLVSLADLTSTGWGLMQPRPDMWEIHAAMTAWMPAIVVASVILSFIPEAMFVWGLSLTGISVPKWFQR